MVKTSFFYKNAIWEFNKISPKYLCSYNAQVEAVPNICPVGGTVVNPCTVKDVVVKELII